MSLPKKILLLGAAACFLAAYGCSGDSVQSESGGGEGIFPYPYRIDDLPNGLRLVTVTTEYPNAVAFYTVVQVGSRNEVEPGRSGFAHFFEHMMFRGTEKYPPEKWAEIMQKAGAETNAYTSDDRTVYHAVFSKEDLEPIIELEADRFQNLKYSEEVFKTEAQAVLSEYNKSFANPLWKLEEILRNQAFTAHTYKHTTIGFLEDIERMPEMYDYGLQFFDRYYRPEYTVIALVGDVRPEQTLPLIQKYWGGWKKGSYQAEIPVEPPHHEPVRIAESFHAPTLPLLSVSFHAPAYDDEAPDSAVLDVIAFQAFSENSELYKKLVFQEQKVDTLFPEYEDHRDPFLFSVVARVKKEQDVDYVEKEILAAFEKLKKQMVPPAQLEAVKSHLRYRFGLSMDSTAAIASTLAHYLGLRSTPQTINKRYALYQAVTPEDVQTVAQKYFQENRRATATLKHDAKAATEGAE